MNRTIMQDEFESLKRDFENKWKPRFEECKRNNEDSYKFYRKNQCELCEDIFPILDLAYMIDFYERLGY